MAHDVSLSEIESSFVILFPYMLCHHEWHLIRMYWGNSVWPLPRLIDVWITTLDPYLQTHPDLHGPAIQGEDPPTPAVASTPLVRPSDLTQHDSPSVDTTSTPRRSTRQFQRPKWHADYDTTGGVPKFGRFWRFSSIFSIIYMNIFVQNLVWKQVNLSSIRVMLEIIIIEL